MRLCLISLLLLASAAARAACPALLDRSVGSLDEQAVSLCKYAGNVILVVNTASQCGYTPQYEGLEALYRRYRARGLVVLGFPSNDFGAQEPGSNKDIASFCVNQYAVDFPMFAKTELRKNAFFGELAKRSGRAPAWNFHKYLVDRGGRAVYSFPSALEPNDPKLIEAIERLLSSS
jgi:glutathione peroxidase